jgi:hypothetical protein
MRLRPARSRIFSGRGRRSRLCQLWMLPSASPPRPISKRSLQVRQCRTGTSRQTFAPPLSGRAAGVCFVSKRAKRGRALRKGGHGRPALSRARQEPLGNRIRAAPKEVRFRRRRSHSRNPCFRWLGLLDRYARIDEKCVILLPFYLDRRNPMISPDCLRGRSERSLCPFSSRRTSEGPGENVPAERSLRKGPGGKVPAKMSLQKDPGGEASVERSLRKLPSGKVPVKRPLQKGSGSPRRDSSMRAA